ncbi:MAG: NUDIX hydrolase [Gemmatimonadetes bacterium]|nr:NUDIX hydrolase [Gemmatimonadota bacterium]
MSERSGRRGRDGRNRDGAGARGARVEMSAGGVVYRAGREPLFLLIRDPYQNWGLPKGHIEPDETPEQAALREVAEETGLADLRPRGELPTIDWFFRDRGRLVHKYCHFFLLESRRGEAKPQVDEGISDCLWLPLPAALEKISYGNAREVLRAAGRRVRKRAGRER